MASASPPAIELTTFPLQTLSPLQPSACDEDIHAVISYGLAFQQQNLVVNQHGKFCTSTDKKHYLVKFEGCFFRGFGEVFFGPKVVNSSFYPTTFLTLGNKLLRTSGLKESEKVATALNNKLVDYKATINTNTTIMWGKTTHHPNITQFNTIKEHITPKTQHPLIAMDVDYCLCYKKVLYDSFLGFHSDKGNQHGKVAQQPAEPNFNLISFWKSITSVYPTAQLVLLTNGSKTEKKLNEAGIPLPEGAMILEASKAERQTKVYVNKGQRLWDYIDSKGENFSECHVIDDDLDCLMNVADKMHENKVRCHTYHYIRQYRQKCYSLALENEKSPCNETEALKQLCSEDKKHIAPLAAQNLLLNATGRSTQF